ncbi:MAG: hypothetical protein AAFX04_03690 [Pseudomonadota bacterium]
MKYRHIIAALALTSVVAPTAVEAKIKSSDVRKAYLKGKKKSHYGRSDINSDIRCMILYTVWAGMNSGSYDINLAYAHGELGYGYTQYQFHHYGNKFVTEYANGDAWRGIFMSVSQDFASRDMAKDKEVKNMVEEIGRCAVPHGKVEMHPEGLVRAEHFLNAITNQPYEQSYPVWARDRKAWDSYATAMMNGQFVRAVDIASRSLDSGDTSTFDDQEYMVAIDAAVTTGKADQIPQQQFVRAAGRVPARYAGYAGQNAADYRPQMELVKASATSGLMSSSSAASNQARSSAERNARDRCTNAGGKVLRVNSVPTNSFKATDTTWRATYEATAQCQFPPKR